MKCIDEYIVSISNRPCGPNLEYGADFIQLEYAARAGEEVQYGDKVYSAEPVDWERVGELCQGLLEKTLDLRVAVYFTRALLERRGFGGYVDGLRLVYYLLSECWDSIHPQVLAEENYDPLLRINTLVELAAPATVIPSLMRQVLTRTDSGQALYLADLALIISGVETDDRHQHVAFLANLVETGGYDELGHSLVHLQVMQELLDKIGRCLEEKAAGNGVQTLQALSQSLGKWVGFIEEHLSLGSEVEIAAIAEIESYPVELGVRDGRDGWSGLCESREDVVRALDAICSYYQRYERSSPVPLLVGRIQRLTTMDFLEIIAELAPGSITDLRALGGMPID